MEIPKIVCCEHVPINCFAQVVQKNEDAPPHVTFSDLPSSGVLVLSFKTLHVYCTRCFILTPP